MTANKISEYTEILDNYGKPSLDEFKRFNIKQLREKPETEKQEDKLESFGNNFSIQLLAILKFGKTKEVAGISSVTSPKDQSHIAEEIEAILNVNNIMSTDQNGIKISIKL